MWGIHTKRGGYIFTYQAPAGRDDQEWKERARESATKEVYDILIEWLTQGAEWLPVPGESPEALMPRHPEFAYRLEGEWKGWNHLLGVKAGDAAAAFEEHQKQDRLEAQAWDLWLEKVVPSS